MIYGITIGLLCLFGMAIIINYLIKLEREQSRREAIELLERCLNKKVK
jgi:hypothetical protein